MTFQQLFFDLGFNHASIHLHPIGHKSFCLYQRPKMFMTGVLKFDHLWLRTTAPAFHKLERLPVSRVGGLLVVFMNPWFTTVRDGVICLLAFFWCCFPSPRFDFVLVVLDSFLPHICFSFRQSHKPTEPWIRKTCCQRVCISPEAVLLDQKS